MKKTSTIKSFTMPPKMSNSSVLSSKREVVSVIMIILRVCGEVNQTDNSLGEMIRQTQTSST